MRDGNGTAGNGKTKCSGGSFAYGGRKPGGNGNSGTYRGTDGHPYSVTDVYSYPVADTGMEGNGRRSNIFRKGTFF